MPGHSRSPKRKFSGPANTKGTIKRLLSYFKGYKVSFAIVIVSLVISSLATIAGIYLLKPLINEGIAPFIGQKNPDLFKLISIIIEMIVVYGIGALGTYLYRRLMLGISTGILMRIRQQMFGKMETLSIRYFDKRTHGEIMSRYTNDTDAMREMLSNSITEFIASAIRIAGIFAMMLIMSPLLTLISVVALFLMTLCVRSLGKRSSHYFRQRQSSLGQVNGYIEEMIEGQKVVKAFCHEDAVKKRFGDLNEVLRHNDAQAQTFASILMPILGNLSYILYAITAAAGGIMAVNALVDVGTIASFLQYTRTIAMPISQISQQFNNILSALAGAERIFNLIDETPETDEGSITLVNVRQGDSDDTLVETAARTGKWAWKRISEDGVVSYIPLRGDVRFNHVTFSYDNEKNVLKDISLYAKPGQKIAFVGSTGAGKTTITNLINRFYDIQEGAITYDGIPIKQIKKADLRRSLAMVLQDTHLFTGTVRENIRYGRLDASDEEVATAAKLANAHSFIKRLPDGYDTMLTADGANLSQGQRQLLAIARAAVADPPVLILDEATSSIDTRTESLIEKGMDKLMANRTVFVIAHRLSTVRNSNAIMVLENGEIIERGDHDDLIAQHGRYYQLYMGLFELS